MSDNASQAEYWSSAPGRKWITHEAAMDASMQPILDRLLDRAALAPGQRVLDIGCGAGASTGAAAARVGPGGHVTGADISAPLLERARARFAGQETLRFLQADAQSHAFASDHDRVISRFGVMFFSDPVAAFTNIRRALRPGGGLCFACWGDPAHIPWFSIPAKIAAARLGPPPDSAPTDPGPTAFRDAARVAGILRDAGFADVTCTTERTPIRPPGTAGDAATLAGHLGPAAFLLRHNGGSEADRAAIVASIAAAFARFEGPEGVTLPCEVHLFSATA